MKFLRTEAAPWEWKDNMIIGYTDISIPALTLTYMSMLVLYLELISWIKVGSSMHPSSQLKNSSWLASVHLHRDMSGNITNSKLLNNQSFCFISILLTRLKDTGSHTYVKPLAISSYCFSIYHTVRTMSWKYVFQVFCYLLSLTYHPKVFVRPRESIRTQLCFLLLVLCMSLGRVIKAILLHFNYENHKCYHYKLQVVNKQWQFQSKRLIAWESWRQQLQTDL